MARWPASLAATTVVSSICLKSFFSNGIGNPLRYKLDIIDSLAYFSLNMPISKYFNRGKFVAKATGEQRIIAALVFVIISAVFVVLFLAAYGKIRLGYWLGPCGFKQRFHLPCPSCGMTTSAVTFVKGKIIESFLIQPAGCLFCVLLLISGILSFLTAVFGIYFSFLEYFFRKSNIKYIILALFIIVAAGWAVALARAIVENKAG
jgi:hypothetical protein